MSFNHVVDITQVRGRSLLAIVVSVKSKSAASRLHRLSRDCLEDRAGHFVAPNAAKPDRAQDMDAVDCKASPIPSVQVCL